MRKSFENAYWVGLKDSLHGAPQIRSAFFRLCFSACKNDTLILFVSAHSRYRLYLNGQPLTCGPCKGDRWRHFYEEINASGKLEEGNNILSAQVVSFLPFEAEREDERAPIWTVARSAGPLFLMDGRLKNDESGLQLDVSTGAAAWEVLEDLSIGWKFQPLSHWLGSMEVSDGNWYPHGWKLGKDKGKWVAACNYKPALDKNNEKYGILPAFPLMERPIPLLHEKPGTFKREMPIKKDDLPRLFFREGKALVPPESRVVFELDAGLHTTAFLHMKMAGGSGGKLVVRYAESYARTEDGYHLIKGARDDWENYTIIGHEDVYLPGGENSTYSVPRESPSSRDTDSLLVEEYTPFLMRTFRFIRVEITTAAQPLTLYMPAFTETAYPLEVKTKIYSSEPWIEELYTMSIRTLQNCMHETYEDCPYYEQLQYIQDTRLEMLFTYSVSGDFRLARRAIEDFHASRHPSGLLLSRYPSQDPLIIPPFSIHWIGMLHEYLWETGDTDFIKHYLPTVDSILQWYDEKRGPLGLVENLEYWDFIDWVDAWSQGAGRTPASAKGPSTTHNLLYANGLIMAVDLCNAVKRFGMAEEYSGRAKEISEAVNKLCWSEEEGLYREGPEFFEYSQHANVYAVLCGLKKGKDGRELMERALKCDIAPCSFTWQYFVFRALELCGSYDLTIKQWELWKGLLDKNLTTIPEIPEGETSSRSDCHAWSALALHEFPRRLLGVRPYAYGWDGILIKPDILGLSQISGEVYTPRGMVAVGLIHEDGVLKLKAHAPQGVYTSVIMPDGKEFDFPKGGEIEIFQTN